TNRVEDRRLEHFAGSRSGEALAHVEEISHNENREDGRLGDNQAGHRDLAPIRKAPSLGRLSDWSSDCAHRSIPSLIAAVRIFRMFAIPQRATAGDRRDRGKVVSRWR